MPTVRRPPGRWLVALTAACALLAASAETVRAASDPVSVESSRYGRMVEVHAAADLAADQGTAWQVLTDYARYVDFLPDLRESRVVSRDGSKVVVEQAGSARLGPLDFPVFITYRIVESPPRAVEAHGTAGSLLSLDSHYTLTARPHGSRLEYVGIVRPPSLLFAGIAETAVQSNVRRQFRALVDEIERRHAGLAAPSTESSR